MFPRSLSNTDYSSYINGYPIVGVPFDESVIIYHNGSFFYGTISSAGGISTIVSVGVGQSIIQGSSAGTVFLRSLLSGSPNITVTSTANEIQFTMSGTLTNITSISGTTLALDSPTITFPSTTSGTVVNYLGLNGSGNLVYNTLPTSVGSISNEGTGTGLVYDTTTGGVAFLRSILGDSNVQVSTSGSNIQTFLNPALTFMTSISSASTLTINTPSLLTLSGTNISIPSVPVNAPVNYLGVYGSNLLCKFAAPPTGITTINTSGIGDSIVKSVVGSVATLKSINGTNSIDLTDDTNTLTLSLDPILNNVTEIHTSGGNLLMDASTISWPNISAASTTVTAIVMDSFNRLRYAPFINSFNSAGGGTSLFGTLTGNIQTVNTLNGSANINVGLVSNLITLSTPSTLTDIRTINSATSGNTIFGNDVIMNGGQRFASSVPTTVSPPFYLVLDASNNVNKVAPPSFSSVNIYNTDGTMTALNRTVSPFTPGNINNKITMSNVVHSYINSIRLNPTYLGTTASSTELNFVQFYDALGDPWGKYEATTCESRLVSIPALGAAGGYNIFYASLANGSPAQLAAWNLRVYVYENQPSNLTPWVATYNINISALDNTTAFQSVYPTTSQATAAYLLEVGQAISTNQYTLMLRIRNIGTIAMTNTLTAKVESYTSADKTISTPLTTGNLVRTTVNPPLQTSVPSILLVNVGQNASNAPPNFLWTYANYPRLVKIYYFLSAQSTTIASTTITFVSNGVTVHTQILRTTGALLSTAMCSISGYFFIDAYQGFANGSLLPGALNTLQINQSNNTNQSFTACSYCVNFEFL